MKANDYNDLTIRDASINELIEFPDGTIFKITFHSEDEVTGADYQLIQKRLSRVLKTGELGKSTVWLKFRKTQP